MIQDLIDECSDGLVFEKYTMVFKTQNASLSDNVI